MDAVEAPDRIAPAGRAQLAELLRRQWLLEHTGKPYANNLVRAVRVEGRVDWEALEAAAREVSRRHEALRTSFPAGTTQPRQLIRDGAGIPLKRTRLAGAPLHADPWGAAARILEERSLRARDPSEPVLGSLDAIELGDERSVVALAVDHLVADGVSMDTLTVELSRAYAAITSGTPAGLAPPRQYREFVAWEERERHRPAGAAFWSSRLDGVGPMPRVPLPGLRAQALHDDFRGATFTIDVERDLAAEAQALARRSGMTPFAVWMSAVVASVHATSGQRDVGLLVPVANRGFSGARPIVGWLANTIVVRVVLPAQPRFEDVLWATWDSMLDALDHQTTPWDDLVASWMHEHGEPDGIPPQLFVSAAEATESQSPLALAGCRTEELRHDGAATAHAFDVRFGFSGADVTMNVRYPLGLYDEPAARGVAGHVLATCAALVARPGDAVA